VIEIATYAQNHAASPANFSIITLAGEQTLELSGCALL
jgi:hypothetical protein